MWGTIRNPALRLHQVVWCQRVLAIQSPTESKRLIMSEPKRCPFNGMGPCIGHECAMFLDLKISAALEGDEPRRFRAILDSMNPPCALLVSGYAAYFRGLLDIDIRTVSRSLSAR